MSAELAQIAEAAAGFLRLREIGSLVSWLPNQASVAVHAGPAVYFVSLKSLQPAWGQADARRRDQLLETAFLGVPRHVPLINLETILPRILPRVRSLDYFSSLDLRQELFEETEGESPTESLIPHQSLGDVLALQLAFEMPDQAHDVHESHLTSWGATLQGLLPTALRNLRERSQKPLHEFFPGLFRTQQEDGLDAARLWLPELTDGLRLNGTAVWMAPNAGLLMVTGSEDEAALLEMTRLGLETSQHPQGLPAVALQRSVTGRLDSWLPEEGRSSRAALRTARLPSLLRAYDRQKEILDTRAELLGTPTAGSFLVLEQDDGSLISAAVWLRGEEPFLPRADAIAFIVPEGDAHRAFTVRWEEAVSLAHSMIRTEDRPERWHATGFPALSVLQSFQK